MLHGCKLSSPWGKANKREVKHEEKAIAKPAGPDYH